MALIAITVTSTALLTWDMRERTVQNYERDAYILGTVLAERTARYVQVIDGVLKELQLRVQMLGIGGAEDFQARLGTPETQALLHNRLQNLPQVNAFTLADASGHVASSSRGDWPRDIELSQSDFILHFAANDDHGVFVSTARSGKIVGTPTIFLARRINAPDGHFLGVAIGAIDVADLSDFHRAINTQPGQTVTLLRSDGVVLTRDPDPTREVGQRMPAGAPWYGLVGAGGGTYRSPGFLGGLGALVSVHPLRAYPLVIDVSIKERDGLAVWRHEARLIGSATACAVAGLLVLFWVIGRQMRRQEKHNAAISRTADALRESEAELRQAKDRAEQAETLLRDAVDSISEGFVIYDHEDRFVMCNDTYRQSYTEGAELLIPGARFEYLLHHVLAKGGNPEARGRVREWCEERLRYHREAKGTIEQHLGGGSWILVSDRRMNNGGVAGLRINITALKQAQAALRESEARLERAQAIAGIGSWELDVATGRYIWSKELYHIRGVSPDDFEPNIDNVAMYVDPDDYKLVRHWLTDLQAGAERDTIETRIIRPDGDVRLIRVEGRAMVDADGAVRRLAGTMQDITERRLIEQQLFQAQKMEAIGTLTGGMARDFNNVLGVIIGNLDLLGRSIKGNQGPEELCDEARDGALRCADLIRTLLAFARRQSLRPERTDVNALVEGIGKLLNRTLGEEIELTMQLDPTVWPAMADPAQLEAALTNLATNARDAMKRGGRLAIATSNAWLDADYAERQPDVTPGEYVVIEVSDTGAGIDPVSISRIFEPFFTTKEPGKGTGLGLSMVFGFVKQSGGHIAVYSEPGRGSTFRLYLPRGMINGSEPVVSSDLHPVVGGDETVLVVEDNAQLRRAAVRQLTALGYTTYEADNAEAAVRVLAGENRIDLLFTDVVMPGEMDGIDLAGEAGILHPALRVLLTSGFPDLKGAERRMIGPAYRLLNKPYRHDELARAVRQVLDDTAVHAGQQMTTKEPV